MPSRRRLRHASTSSAPQVLLNSSKSGNLSSSGYKDVPVITSTSPTNSQSYSNNHNYKLTASSATTFPSNNTNNYGNSGTTDGLTEKQLRNAYLITLTKEQLKVECRKRGQKTNGNRAELLQRLGVKLSQLQKQESADSANSRKMETIQSKQQITKSGTNGSPNGTAPSFVRKQSAKDKEREKEEREKIVLWRRPIQTLKYCIMECTTLSHIYGKKLVQHRAILTGVLVLIAILGVFYKIPGRHQLLIELIRTNTWFVVYWVGLGVLSSVGLGTGLHTFILYLGPHVASVTLAAYECNALNFPKPPYPDDIICPEVADTNVPPNLWNIMAKVRLEAFLWGAGTALGELPPYFMAKAARLSGYDPDDDEDLQKFEELQKKQKDKGDLSTMDKAKLFMEKVVEKVGFFGILACASIPNPLFDLAGITCGHFLVPFWTFFGATLLGKAVIKMHIQKIFVIIAFNESLLDRAVDLLALVPIFGRRLQEPFKSFLENQKNRLHRQKNIPITESGNLLAKLFEKFVILMICYFVISIVNSLAQSYHKRIHKKGGKVLRKIAKD